MTRQSMTRRGLLSSADTEYHPELKLFARWIPSI